MLQIIIGIDADSSLYCILLSACKLSFTVRDIEGAVKVGERISYMALVFKGKPNSYNHMVLETLMSTEYLYTVCVHIQHNE